MHAAADRAKRATRRKPVNYAEMVASSEESDAASVSSDDRPVRKRTRASAGSSSTSSAVAPAAVATTSRPRLERNAKRTAAALMVTTGLSDSELDERGGNSESEASLPEADEQEDELRDVDYDEEDETGASDQESGFRRRSSRGRVAKTRANAKRALIVNSDESDHEDMPKKKRSTPRKQSSRSYSTPNQKAITLVPGDDMFVDYRIHSILTSQTKTMTEWNAMLKDMNTDEIFFGSVWKERRADPEDPDQPVERLLVKWKGLSYMHLTWELEEDLLEQLGPLAKVAINRFRMRVQTGEDLFYEELRDNEYFPPSYLEVERVLDVDLADVADPPSSPAEGTAASALSERARLAIKWAGLPYTEATFESVADLRKRNIEFADAYTAFLKREATPPRKWQKEINRKIVFDEVEDDEKEVEFSEGNFLRGYQWEGVRWLVYNWTQNRNSILADEMGLGKTIQTAAFLEMLNREKRIRGPSLIIVPLSTITNWYRELRAWTSLDVVQFYGSREARDLVREYEFRYVTGKYNGVKLDILLTTPEVCLARDASFLGKIKWEILVFDEAHRLKNHESKLAQTMRTLIQARNTVLLTGTPLQNNTEELWALLNFVDPVEFSSVNDFLAEFGDLDTVESLELLQKRLKPYLLRRLKEDVEKTLPGREEIIVEVELTAVQKQYYRAIYERNVAFLNRSLKASDMPQMLNLAMELRKCCNHPFLVRGAETELQKYFHSEGKSEIDCLIGSSGKLVLLDKLLPKLKAEGRKVLLFSQFRIMLDILEDYLHVRNYSYERVDGAVTGARRQFAIDRFTSGDENLFVMLLSTRAGGVGINLTAADVVVLYDSDWNPQNDLQAMARCHRIGQTNKVNVYRLVTGKTYEMQMFKDASLKLGLDQAVLHSIRENWLQRKDTGAEGAPLASRKEVENLLKYGAYDIFREAKDGKAEEESQKFVDESIDSILARATHITRGPDQDGKSSVTNSLFSHASFVPSNEPQVELDDPSFWTKVVGLPVEQKEEEMPAKRRSRTVVRSYGADLSEDDFSDLDGLVPKPQVDDPGSQSYSENNDDDASSSASDHDSDVQFVEDDNLADDKRDALPGAPKPKTSRRRRQRGHDGAAPAPLAPALLAPHPAGQQHSAGQAEYGQHQYPSTSMALEQHYMPQYVQITPYGQMVMQYHPHMMPVMLDGMMQPVPMHGGMPVHPRGPFMTPIVPAPPHPNAAGTSAQQASSQQQQQQQKRPAPLLPKEGGAQREKWNDVSRDQLFKNLTATGMFKFPDMGMDGVLTSADVREGCYWLVLRLIVAGSTFPQTVAGTNAAKELLPQDQQHAASYLIEPTKFSSLMSDFLLCRVVCCIYFDMLPWNSDQERSLDSLVAREAALLRRASTQRLGTSQPFTFGDNFLDTGNDSARMMAMLQRFGDLDMPAAFLDDEFNSKIQKRCRQFLDTLETLFFVHLIVKYVPVQPIRKHLEPCAWRERPRVWWCDNDDLCLLEGIDMHGLPENQVKAAKIAREKRLPWSGGPDSASLSKQELSRRFRFLEAMLFGGKELQSSGPNTSSPEYRIWRTLLCYGQPRRCYERVASMYPHASAYALHWKKFIELAQVEDDIVTRRIVQLLLHEMAPGPATGDSSVLPLSLNVLKVGRSSMRDMERLRLLVTMLDWNDLQWWCANTHTYPAQLLPPWWSPRHDRRLVWAVVKFGWHNWQDMLAQQIKPFDRPLPEGPDDPSANSPPLTLSPTTYKYIEHRCQELAQKVDDRLTYQNVLSGAIRIERDEKGRFVGFALGTPQQPFSEEELEEENVPRPELPLVPCPDPETARLVDEILAAQRMTLQQYLQQVADAAQLATTRTAQQQPVRIAPAPSLFSNP